LGNRAIFDTGAATGAQIFFDAAGAFAHFDFKIAWLAFNRFQVCIGD
jgi:hypothetical protein